MGWWTVSLILPTFWLLANGGRRFITRDDASPLMDALVLWRTTALQSHHTDLPSRAPSPSPQSEEEPLSSSDERDDIKRSDSDPIELSRKPTSSSWSRWWSRSRIREGDASSKGNRPELRETASDAVGLYMIRVRNKADNNLGVKVVSHGTQLDTLSMRPSAVSRIAFPSASAPPSTPVVQPKPENAEAPAPEVLINGHAHSKKFAKTLRLTSDQLVYL
jgi:phosphatidate phosphatase LPIN